MRAAPALLLLISFSACAAAAAAREDAEGKVNTEKAVHTVQEGFASFDMDWWGSENAGWGNASVLNIDFSSPRLRNYAAAIKAQFLRIGGSEDVDIKYLVGDMTKAECEAPTHFRGMNITKCLTMERWGQILDFADAAGAKLVFGLSFFTNSDGSWNMTNAEALLRYTASQSKALFAIELGEEMAPAPGTSAYKGLVDGYSALRSLLKELWPDNTPLVMGPCVGMGDEPPETASFWRAFAHDTANTTDVIVMHSYNNDGGDGWKKPGFLEQTLSQARAMYNYLASIGRSTPLWCGECGPHNGSGVKGKTDRVLSSFWFVDALGALARLGLEQFGRQSLVGGNYGLLQKTTHLPNPDVFVAMIWNTLMGPRVLDLVMPAKTNTTLHAYAHCHPANNGSLTVAFVNIDNATDYSLKISGFDASQHVDYLFSATNLLSQDVVLNGKQLDTSGQEPPPLHGVAATGDTIAVKALTYGFVFYPHANAAGCQ